MGNSYSEFINDLFEGGDIPSSAEGEAACLALYYVEGAMRAIETHGECGNLKMTPEADDAVYIRLQDAAAALRRSLGINSDAEDTPDDGDTSFLDGFSAE